jgi:copper homeostasis protein
MSRVLLEVCVDDARGLDAAVAGGADRIELCSALESGGLTPSPGLIARAKACPVPVFALIRPRTGNFHYERPLVETMLGDIDAIRSAGLAGVVVGASLPDGRLDVGTLALLLAQATGLSTTLHRAFDLVPDVFEALETAVALGFSRILTSGGEASAFEGRVTIQALVKAAAGRIRILASSGIRPGMAADLVAFTGVGEVHSSCSSPGPALEPRVIALGFGSARPQTTDRVVEALRRELDALLATEM